MSEKTPQGSRKKYASTHRFLVLAHVIEGLSMIITGPLILLRPEILFSLYNVVLLDEIASDSLRWFGALVTLMVMSFVSSPLIVCVVVVCSCGHFKPQFSPITQSSKSIR